MNILSSLLFVTLFLDLLIAGIMFWKTPKNLSAGFFGLYLIGNAWWAAGLIYLLAHPAIAAYSPGSLMYSAGQFTYLAPIVLMSGKLWFLKSYLNRGHLLTSFWDYLAIALTVMLTALVSVSGMFFTEFSVHASGYLTIVKGPLVGLFTLFVLFHYIYPFFVVRQRLREVTSEIIKKQFQLLIWSHGVITGCSMITNWILPRYLDVPQLTGTGPIFSLAVGVMFAYAITHLKFFNLKIRFVQTLTYATAGLILSIFAWRASAIFDPQVDTLLVNATSILTAIALFSPLTKYLQKAFNLLIFGHAKNHLERMREKVLALVAAGVDVKAAAAATLDTVQKTLGLSYCHFLPLPALAVAGHEQLFRDGNYLYTEELAGRAEVECNPKIAQFATDLRERGIAVIQPIVRNGSVIGTLAAGQKVTGELFTEEELEEIRHVAESTVMYFGTFADEHLAANPIAKKFDRTLTLIDDLEHHIAAPLTRAILAIDCLEKSSKKHSKELCLAKKDIFQASRAFQNYSTIENLPACAELMRDSVELLPVVRSALDNLKFELERRNYCAQTKKDIVTAKIDIPTTQKVLGNRLMLADAVVELLLNAVLHGKQPIMLLIRSVGDRIELMLGNATATSQTPTPQMFVHSGEYEGNGLGLPLVEKFAEAVGGSLQITNNGKRITVTLSLPKAE